MITLTRQQISRIVGGDQAAVRAFEAFFQAVNTDLPTVQTADTLEAGAALALANEAATAAMAAANVAAFAALAPAFAPVPGGLSVDPAAATVFDATIADLAPATGALIGD